MMGSPENEAARRNNEGPQRKVSIQKFAVGQFEVTFAEWDACVKGGGCDGYTPRDLGARGLHPVVKISWHDAQSYVQWLSKTTGKNYRLLTEAEWEYVARGGTTTRFFFGDEKRSICKYANGGDKNTLIAFVTRVCRDGSKHPAAVGSYKPNPYGLYDIYGNVWEWVADEWHKNYSGAPEDGRAWGASAENKTAYRVLRGGSWSSDPFKMRSAARGARGPDFRSFRIGLRVARDL